jgi:hypothetical protein
VGTIKSNMMDGNLTDLLMKVHGLYMYTSGKIIQVVCNSGKEIVKGISCVFRLRRRDERISVRTKVEVEIRKR